MGVTCPICLTHQAVVRNITINGDPAEKATDVVARRLACGHVLGGEKYNEYILTVRDIEIDAATKKNEIDQAAYSKKAALWKGMDASGQVI